jgi:hypothetical protein
MMGGWTLDELLALPVEYYEVLIEIAPEWLKGPEP